MSGNPQRNRVTSTTTPLDAARVYVERHWHVVPVAFRTKAPLLKGWQNLRCSTTDLHNYFDVSPMNIGLILGEPSGGLIDVDLDAPEALAAADSFLPQTPLVHGRLAKPRSHRWYVTTPALQTEQFRDLDGTMLVELRSTGLQTIVPPSVHPSGEALTWDSEGVPPQVAPDLIQKQVRLLAACSLIARHWPKQGSRQEAALALSGGLLRGGWQVEEAENFIGAVARAAHDEELRKRIEVVGHTAKKLAQGAPVTGWNSLASNLEQSVVDRIREFLRIPPTVEGTEPSTPAGLRWPAPPADEAFYGLAGKIVRTIEPHSESDAVAILAQSLVAFGSIIGRGPHFVFEGDVHFTNLFAVLVGKTAKARKGTSWGQTRRIFSEVDPEWTSKRVISGLSSGEGLIWAVRDPIEKTEAIREGRRITGYQIRIDDHGISDKRLLILSPEFASTLRLQGRDGSILSTTLREAWDTGNLNILNKNSPAKATGAHISVIGHITGEELRRTLDDTEKANGYANRFLWYCVRRSKLLPDGGQPGAADLQVLRAGLMDAVTFARTVGELKRDDGARQAWHRVYGELSEGRPGLLGAILARPEPQVMRLACIYALLDKATVIREEHLLAALALWEYCEESCRFIFGNALGDPVADVIYQELLKRPGGMTRTEIRDYFGRNRGAHEIDRALLVLQEHGLAVRASDRTEGRPAERWVATRYAGAQQGTTETT